jgi:hypothetical protein
VLRGCERIRHIIFRQESPFHAWECDAEYYCPIVETLDLAHRQASLFDTLLKPNYWHKILAVFPALKELCIRCMLQSYQSNLYRGTLSLSSILGGLTFYYLSLISLSGITCSESDLEGLFSRHAKTLQDLCLGDVLLNGTWASVFNNLRCQMAKLSLKSITINKLKEEFPKPRIQFMGSKKGMETLALFLSLDNVWKPLLR